jgi:hypothetical protein
MEPRSATNLATGASVSYNPILCIEANSSYLWDTELRPGNAGTWDGSLQLLDTYFANTPPDIREIRVRADAGFGFNPVFETLESRPTQYAVVARLATLPCVWLTIAAAPGLTKRQTLVPCEGQLRLPMAETTAVATRGPTPAPQLPPKDWSLRGLCNKVSEITTWNGRPGRTRTCNPRIRNPMLYPLELRAQSS